LGGDSHSGAALAISWNDSKKEKKGKVLALFVASAMSLAVINPAMRTSMADGVREMVSVIVRELPGAGNEPEKAVERLGGTVKLPLGIIGGFSADVPRERLYQLRQIRGIYAVTPDAQVEFSHSTDGFDADKDPGSMFRAAQEEIGAGEYWNDGYTGKGVDVALIDTGVVPVNGLTTPGKIVNGPDLSFDSQFDEVRYLDTFGHGTHMAGIIAGRDDAVTKVQKGNHDNFLGVAPDARIVNVKVGNDVGAADVSQVIAGISWVVQHRSSDGMNIRVLNLSFGTDGTQDYVLDPLTYAAEVAWRKGIVVVVAAGNEGFGSPKLNNPAYDPYVLAVGAAVQDGKYGTDGDAVAEFSSGGSADRRADLVAPGKSIVSLRDEGSYVDETYPDGRVGTRYFRGSGTSQASAIVAGAAALVIEQRPSIKPDQVKKLLTTSANNIRGDYRQAQGAGMIDLKRARDRSTPALSRVTQVFPSATGTGSLELARGTVHLADEDDIELTGEMDIFGMAWDPTTYSSNLLNDTSWADGAFNGSEWTGGCFCADSWSGRSWSGRSWSGRSWSGRSWSGRSWSGRSWSGRSWSGVSWSGRSWSGASWSGRSWSGRSWSGRSWSSADWG
jgi:serine protease AprX